VSAPPGTAAPATWADVNRDVIRTIGMPGEKYFAWMCLVALTLACGVAAWTWQIWIGIGHAGTLISAILYLFRAKWRTSIYRDAETRASRHPFPTPAPRRDWGQDGSCQGVTRRLSVVLPRPRLVGIPAVRALHGLLPLTSSLCPEGLGDDRPWAGVRR
jgi:hypothetical protein